MTLKKFDLYLERLSKSTASRGPLGLEIENHVYILIFDYGWIIRLITYIRNFRYGLSANLDYPKDLCQGMNLINSRLFKLLHSLNIKGLIKLINEKNYTELLIDFENQMIDEFYVSNIKRYTSARVTGIQRFIIDRGYVPELSYDRIKGDGIEIDSLMVAGMRYSKCFSKGDSFIEGFELNLSRPVAKKCDASVAYLILGSNQEVNQNLIKLFRNTGKIYDNVQILLHPLISRDELKNNLTGLDYELKLDRKWFYADSDVYGAPTTLLLSLDGIVSRIYLMTERLDQCFAEEFQKSEIIKLS